MRSADTLPDDIEALKALLRERDARLEHMQDVVDSQKAVIATGKVEIGKRFPKAVLTEHSGFAVFGCTPWVSESPAPS
ncbi:MAG: hypothetical protein WDN30_08145 [Pararobbsia sp.]